MKGKKDMKKQQYARAECVVRLVVDALLAAGAFDPYWLNLPFSQRELTSRSFLRGGRVPREVLKNVHELLEAFGRS